MVKDERDLRKRETEREQRAETRRDMIMKDGERREWPPVSNDAGGSSKDVKIIRNKLNEVVEMRSKCVCLVE